MKSLPAIGAVLLLLSQSSHADVTAKFIKAEEFTDFTLSGRGGDRAQSAFEAELKKQRGLQSFVGDRKLELTFTDIDMAGDTKRLRAMTGNNTRLIKGVYPPRMSFSYVLRDKGGRKITSGSASIKDLTFDRRLRGSSSTRRFYFELTMLERWIRSNLPK
ncbi:MAG: DUF3016 domain-containing protein [Verrucomicrobiota bacterium]